MTYRITENVNLPFNLVPAIKEYKNGDIEIRVQVNFNILSSEFTS